MQRQLARQESCRMKRKTSTAHDGYHHGRHIFRQANWAFIFRPFFNFRPFDFWPFNFWPFSFWPCLNALGVLRARSRTSCLKARNCLRNDSTIAW
jgi:hypothetical protein